MVQTVKPLLETAFLRAHFDTEYTALKDSPEERALAKRLALWAARTDLKETSAEQAFTEEFFRATWGYVGDGQDTAGRGHTLYPKYPIKGAGEGGGTG